MSAVDANAAIAAWLLHLPDVLLSEEHWWNALDWKQQLAIVAYVPASSRRWYLRTRRFK